MIFNSFDTDGFIVFRKLISALLLAVAVSSCTSTVPKLNTTTDVVAQIDLKSIYAELAKTGGTLFALDPKKSTVRIYAFRSGRFANLGHNHVLSAPEFTGFFYLPSDSVVNSRFDLEFHLDKLEIDNPVIRTKSGKAFSSKLSPEAISSTREHMLSDDNFQANRFPFVHIHSLQISGEAPKFAAKIQINMHGQTREMWVPLNVEGLPDRLTVSGSFVLRQTEFGVQPFSVLGGQLAVQDEVVIEFELIGI
jgi:hypothetical protein